MDYIVNTPCGTLQGCAGRVPGTVAYKGIRYATAERWKYPEQITHWDGIYDATQYGACCYQARAFYNEEDIAEKAFYYREFRRGETYTYSEDCLFLNIWTPETAQEGDQLPVLLYIHGGSFTGGCGHEKHFDGPVWPTKGVIAVTINYRLGPFGFACLPELKEESGSTGNYGLFDQLTAIRWIRDNIASFGGNPSNITIMGQSAGAMSVEQLCLSPLSENLFHKAVMCSGGGMSRYVTPRKPEKSYAFWQTLMERTGCRTLKEFRALPAETLFSSWKSTKKDVKGGGSFPCLDGKLVVGGKHLIRAGKYQQIPYMVGATSEDIAPPMMLSLSRIWCASQKVPSFTWLFDRQLPGDNNGAWHSADLWYWFGTLDNCWRPMTEKDRTLSEQMSDYLTNFCKTGDPNAEGVLPYWSSAAKGNKQVLCLGEQETAMRKPKMLKMIKTMLTSKSVGE